MPTWEQTTLTATPPKRPVRSESVPNRIRPQELMRPIIPSTAAAWGTLKPRSVRYAT